MLATIITSSLLILYAIWMAYEIKNAPYIPYDEEI